MLVRVIQRTPGLAALLGVTVLGLAAPAALAQHRHHLPPGYCPPPQQVPCLPGTPVPTAPAAPTAPAPDKPQQQPEQQPQAPAAPDTAAQQPSLPSEQAAAAGGEAVAFAAPAMIGDLLSGSSVTRVVRLSSGVTVAAALPSQARGAFKIAENESPRPLNRVFFTYNYFNNVNESLNPVGFPRFDIHREVVGFEKTFANRDASFGMRLPLLQIDGDAGIRDRDIGDLSLILKYAFVNDLYTGNVLSAGLVVTIPTGGSSSYTFVDVNGDKIHPTLIQPWVGFIYTWGDVYAQGFSAIAVPTDDRDVTSLFNDLGVGWVAYRAPSSAYGSRNAWDLTLPGGSAPDPTLNAFAGGAPLPVGGDYFLSALIPTVEAHITTPLDHRGASVTDPIQAHDQVILTAGVHAVFFNRATLLIGAATPITGPQPFDVEATVQFNVRF